MKKTLLLSVVASSMIMAGGDIAPVEPVVEAPIVAEVSGWEFGGTAVVYYQTDDEGFSGDGSENSLFSQGSSAADAGIQLRAMNTDVFAGIGAGFEVSGLATLNLENSVVSNVMQGTGNGDLDDITDGGWISQAYLTYGFGNTSIKAGRQELPKSLSPFAFSEKWNVFSNTFDSVLVVNTDISNTVLVGAWVAGANYNAFGAGNNMTDFNSLNGDRGVWMLTAQNKSIENLTLTGSWYYANEFITTDDLNALWGDAQYDATSFNVGIQGGTMMHDSFADDMVAFGAKVGTTFGGIHAMLAYSNVNDGGFGMIQLGGTTSVLYTDLLSDQLLGAALPLRYDADRFVVKGHGDVLGGTISAAYGYTDAANIEMNEFNLGYSVNVATGFDLSLAYAYLDIEDKNAPDYDMNVVRVIGTYNF